MKAWGLTPTQWDQLPRGDQAVILMHEANEGDRCPNCGNRLDSDDPFEVVQHECRGCQQIHQAVGKKDRKPGVFHTIRRIIRND